jgi:hypothetical protein
MAKKILQILGIILFFFLIGYILTYPYELSYHGSDTVVLLEDSYEVISLEELVNRKEFKGKVLYIRIWEPFDTEYKPYTDKELETFRNQLDSLKENTDSNEYKRFAMKIEGRILQKISIEEQLDALETIFCKYKNSDVAFVFITDPDNDFQSRKDDLRKWKLAVKKYETAGYHLIMNPKLAIQTRQHFKKTTNSGALPRYLLADKQGNILNNQAPYPQDTTLLCPQINQLLAN